MTRYFATLSATAVALFAAVWLWVAAAPLAYLDPEYPAWLAKRQMLAQCDLGDLLIVGDSRAAVDIMPTLLPIKATNLAVGGGSPIEVYVAVAHALACPHPPRRVIVSLGANHFAVPDLFWERTVRFGFLDQHDLAEFERLSHRLGDNSYQPRRSDGLPSSWLGKLYAMRFPPFYFSSLLKGGVFLRWWQNRAMLAHSHDTRGQYFFGTEHGSGIVAAEGRLHGFTPLPVLDHYFARMLTLLAARGVPVDFVAMPMNQATWESVRPAVRDAFAAYLAAYAARYDNFHVVGEVMPHWPNRWFGDEFAHLNPAGARRFSAALADWLQPVSSSAAGRAAEHAERGAIGMVQ